MNAYVAEDAGGANLTLHAALKDKEFSRVFVFGIAKDIASNLGVKAHSNEMEITGITRVVAGANAQGTAKAADLFLRRFNSMKVPIFGFLDGWDNLENRFPGLRIRKYLVVDEYSKRIAESIYGSSKVELSENHYRNQVLEDHANLVAKLSDAELIKKQKTIIYFSRPSEGSGSEAKCTNSFCICADLSIILKKFPRFSVLVRDHPTLNSRKCILRFSIRHDLQIERTEGVTPLGADLSRCSVAIGQSNPALLIAQDAGLMTFTTSENARYTMGMAPIFTNLI